MIFTEQKLKTRYKYTVEDAFGTITITSPDRLVEEKDGKINPEFLDDVFMAIYEQHKNDRQKIIRQTIKDTKISYVFEKKDQWEDLEDGKQKLKINLKDNE